jgi:hypothetical protein
MPDPISSGTQVTPRPTQQDLPSKKSQNDPPSQPSSGGGNPVPLGTGASKPQPLASSKPLEPAEKGITGAEINAQLNKAKIQGKGTLPEPVKDSTKATPEFNNKARQVLKEVVPQEARDFLNNRGVRIITPKDFSSENVDPRALGLYDPDTRQIRIPEFVMARNQQGELTKVPNGSRSSLPGTAGHEAAHALADVSGMDLRKGGLIKPLQTAYDNDILAAQGRKNLTEAQTKILNYYRYGTYTPTANQKEKNMSREAIADVINGSTFTPISVRSYSEVKDLLPNFDRVTRREMEIRTGVKPKAENSPSK